MSHPEDEPLRHAEAAGDREEGGAEAVIQVRHDLRNPLAHIMGFAELLQEAASRANSPEWLPDLKSIERESDRLIAVINSTLQPGFLRDGTGEVHSLLSVIAVFRTRVAAAVERLSLLARDRDDRRFIEDLGRIQGAVDRLGEVASGPLTVLDERFARARAAGAERFPDAGVLAVDCSLLSRLGEAFPLVELERRLGEVLREFAVASREAQYHGWIVCGAGYAVMESAPGTPPALTGLADLALKMRRMADSLGMGGKSFFKAGLARGALIRSGTVGPAIWGEALSGALRLAFEAEAGTIRVGVDCVEALSGRYRCEAEENGTRLSARREEQT